MLAGIAVLAVIGGAFAFKAKSNFLSNVYTTTVVVGSAPGTCSNRNFNAITTIVQPTPQTPSVYYTTGLPGTCVTTLYLKSGN